MSSNRPLIKKYDFLYKIILIIYNFKKTKEKKSSNFFGI